MLKKIALLLITSYQVILRGLLPPACRFYPSCSEYCHQAIAQQGVFKGSWLALQRILKCHPWHIGGVDELKKE